VHRVGTTAARTGLRFRRLCLRGCGSCGHYYSGYHVLTRLKNASGGVRAELAFILIGAGLSDGLHDAALIPAGIPFFGPSRAIWFAPFASSFQSRTRVRHRHSKNLEVGFFLRRAMAYVLLVV